MELQDLWNNQDWIEEELRQEEISAAMRNKTLGKVQKLYRYYYLSILLNSLFLATTIGLYFLFPSREIILPLFIIGSCFAFILFNIVWQLFQNTDIDTTLSLRHVLETSLTFNKSVNDRIRLYYSLIMTSSFVGGFLLGLIFSGWTFEKMIAKPVIFLVLLVLTVLFYFFSKSRQFKQFHSRLSPGYHKTKQYLEEQLALLISTDE